MRKKFPLLSSGNSPWPIYARNQGRAISARVLDRPLHRGSGLGDRRVEEQAGRAAVEGDADALARARIDQQRVEPHGDLRQEAQRGEFLALRPDDQEAALGHANAPFWSGKGP